MTISIGFICKDSIVLAADSQGSFEGSTHKQTNVDKLVEFQFRNGYAVCVMADSLEFFEMFRELMSKRAVKTKITSERSIPDTFEKAMFDLKECIRKLSLPIQRSRERMNQLFGANNFELTIGFYFKGVPCLYGASFFAGRVRQVNEDYRMIGTPLFLVNYIMTGLRTSQLSNAEGLATAAYVIQMAKNHDTSCSGITRMALIDAASPHILAQDEIVPFVHAASKFESQKQKTWPASVVELVPRTVNVEWLLPTKRPARAASHPSSSQRPSSPKRGRKRPPASQE